MTDLTREALKADAFSTMHVSTPTYDIDRMVAETKASPMWLHFGAGNIFRIFIPSLT